MAVDAIPVRLPTNLVAVTIPLKYASEPVKNPTVVIPDTYKELKEPIPPITSMAVDAIPVRLPTNLVAVTIPVALIFVAVKNPKVVIPETLNSLIDPIPPITSVEVVALPVRLPTKLVAVMMPVVLILEFSVNPCAIVAVPAVDAYPADVTIPTIEDADILCKLLPSP